MRGGVYLRPIRSKQDFRVLHLRCLAGSTNFETNGPKNLLDGNSLHQEPFGKISSTSINWKKCPTILKKQEETLLLTSEYCQAWLKIMIGNNQITRFVQDTELSWQIEFAMPRITNFNEVWAKKSTSKGLWLVLPLDIFCWYLLLKVDTFCLLLFSIFSVFFINFHFWHVGKAILFLSFFWLNRYNRRKRCIREPRGRWRFDSRDPPKHPKTSYAPLQPITLPPGCCSLVRLKSKGSKRPPHNLGFGSYVNVRRELNTLISDEFMAKRRIWRFPGTCGPFLSALTARRKRSPLKKSPGKQILLKRKSIVNEGRN